MPLAGHCFRKGPLKFRLKIVVWFLSLISVPTLSLGNKEPQSHIPTLENIIDSVEQHFPSIRQAMAEVRGEEGQLMASRSPFDLELSAELGENKGYPSLRYQEVGIRSQLWGTPLKWQVQWDQASGGYFPPYEGELNTGSEGRYKAKLELPLLRDLFTDTARTRALVQSLKVESTRELLRQQRFETFFEAASQFWLWQMAENNLCVGRDLLKAAEENQVFIDKRVQKGDAAAIEAVENQKILAQRRGQLTQLEFDRLQAAQGLSLFWRSQDQRPMLPSPTSQCPAFPMDPPDIKAVEWNLETLVEQLPSLRKLKQDLEAARAQMRLSSWNRLPKLDIKLEQGRYLGNLPPGRLDALDQYLGLEFQFPLLNLGARGQYQRDQARVEALTQELLLKTNQWQIKLHNLVGEIEALSRQLSFSQTEVKTNEKVLQAEKKRFSLGGSSLFVVNLREVELAQAKIKWHSTWVKYQQKMMLLDLLHNRWIRSL